MVHVSPAPSTPPLPSVSSSENIPLAEEAAVLVRQAVKYYGPKKKRLYVLVNYDMTVRRGTIYGLLGPSGAGKTSLLSVVVGLKKLNSGEVWVLGGRPGSSGSKVPGRSLGYMPQELSLYGEFNMVDMMMYFGWIYGMTVKQIEERINFMMDLLDLKARRRKIKNLSGGQQRRVSLAVALMYKPELLILDEPTVGMDPVLRQTIWNHLVELVNEGGTTIIITTHYIEEARQAHTIGLMRNGRLLAEDSPDNLLKIYKADTLEAVFLQLAQHDESSTLQLKMPPYDRSKHGSLRHLVGKKVSYATLRVKLSQMHALVHKNFLTLWRNPGILIFFLILPLVQILLFFTAIGGEPNDILLTVVNDEVPTANDSNTCVFEARCTFQNLSCRYLDKLEKTMIYVEYHSNIEAARQRVLDGDAWGYLHFNANFSEATMMRQLAPTEEAVHYSQIEAHLDMTDQQINFMIQRDLLKAYMNFAKALAKDCGKNEDAIDVAVVVQDPVYGSTKPSFREFAAPGIIVTVVFFLAVGQTSMSLIAEKSEGMMARTTVAGVTENQILFGHVLCQLIIVAAQVILVLIFTLHILGVACHGSMALLVLITTLQGICGMCYGYMISAACDVERTAIELALGSFYPCIMLSGVIWPVDGMHYIMRCMAYGTPITLSILGVRGIMSRGWGWRMAPVYLGIITPILWIAFFLVITILIFKFKPR